MLGGNHRSSRARAVAALAVAALIQITVMPVSSNAAAPRAMDYVGNPGLSQPTYETTREVHRVPMSDGVQLYTEVVRSSAPGRFPVIVELSPYHGTGEDRNGTTTLPYPSSEDGSEGLTGYFAPRGYAVVIADLRGTGRSQGCLDQLGPTDAKDARTLIEWAADRPWSNGRVGMAGFSYVAATQVLAAAQQPRGLVTIVPNAGLASMYDHQFQAGVPYSMQWVGPQAYYVGLSIARHLPPVVDGLTGDNFGNDMQYAGCGAVSSSLTSDRDSQLSGEYTSWHGKRDFREKAEDAPIPIFLVHGINDQAARIAAADWFFERDLVEQGDKLWLGPWDHATQYIRRMQFTAALHAWFDHHLQQRTYTDANGNVHEVETGPPVEVFLSDSPLLEGARFGLARTEIFAASKWPKPKRVDVYAGQGAALVDAPPATGNVSFVGDPRDTGTTGVVEQDYDDDTAATGHVEFVGAPVLDETFFLGRPRLKLVASVSVPRVHLIATIYDQSPGGQRRRLSTCAINPELRHGVAAPEPVVPLLSMDLEPPCFMMAHVLDAGHRLVLRITTSNKDKVASFAVDPRVTVYLGAQGTHVSLPVVEGAAFARDDVPLDESPTGPSGG